MIRRPLPARFRPTPGPNRMNPYRDDQKVNRQRTPRPARQRGFTLIEIMVVVIIIGLLAAVIVPSVINKVGDARVSKAKADIQRLQTALTMFRLHNSKYPNTDQGLEALVN